MQKKQNSNKDNKKDNPNRQYKKRIKSLIHQVWKGSTEAEAALKLELDKSSQARKIAERMYKMRKRKRGSPLDASTKLKAKKKPTYGTAFKPFQGGRFK